MRVDGWRNVLKDIKDAEDELGDDMRQELSGFIGNVVRIVPEKSPEWKLVEGYSDPNKKGTREQYSLAMGRMRILVHNQLKRDAAAELKKVLNRAPLDKVHPDTQKMFSNYFAPFNLKNYVGKKIRRQLGLNGEESIIGGRSRVWTDIVAMKDMGRVYSWHEF